MNTGPPILEYPELAGESPKGWKLQKHSVKNWIQGRFQAAEIHIRMSLAIIKQETI